MPPKQVSKKGNVVAAASSQPEEEKPEGDVGAPAAAVPRRRGFMERWRGLYDWVHWVLHVTWITLHVALCNFVSRRSYQRGARADAAANLLAGDGRTLRRHRKLVMVGDDTALGLGDWVTVYNAAPPGLLRLVGPRPIKELFLRWHLFAAASRGSGTRDWLPAGHEEAPTGVSPKGAPIPLLFEQTFHPEAGEHRDADVVILCVGGMDPVAADPVAVAKRVVAIAEELERRGHRVIVVHPITTRHAKETLPPEKVERLVSRADAVDRAVRARWPEQALATTMVKLGPRIDFVLHNKGHWRFGGRYVSGSGYKLWAKAWADAVGFTMKAAEAGTYLALIDRRKKVEAAPMR